MRLGGGVRSRLAVGLPVVAASASLVAALMAAAAARSTIETVERLRVDELRDRAGLALALDAARLRLAFRDGRTLDVREGFEDGRLVASSAWPEAVDTRGAPPEAPAGSDSFVWSVPTARGPRAAWVTRERAGADGPPDES